LQELSHPLVTDDRPLRVHLQDERLRTVPLRSGYRLFDGRDHDPVEQARHLENFDRCEALGCAFVGGGHGGTEEREPDKPRERGNEKGNR